MNPERISSNKSRLNLLWLVAQIGLGAIFLVAIFWTNQIDVQALWEHLTHAALMPLLGGIAAFVVTIWLNSLRLRLLLGSTVPAPYLLGATFFQNAMLTLMPWRLGETGLPLLLRGQFGIPLLDTVTIIIATRMIDLGIVLGVALASAGRLGFSVGLETGYVLAIGIFLILIAGMTAARYGKLPFSVSLRLRILSPLRTLRGLVPFLVLSVGVFCGATIQSTLVLNAMSLDAPLIDVAILNAWGLLAALLPIHPPGGWGTMDSIQLAILLRLSYEPVSSSISILSAHLFYMVLITLGGYIGWLVTQSISSARRHSIDVIQV